MAKFYGKESRYLINSDHEYFLWAIGVVVAPVVLIAILAKFSSPAVLITAAVVLLLFVLKGMQPIVFYLKTKSEKFYKGRYGEKDIRKELSELPDAYSVFQGVMLDKVHGDIDFVLVGPQGILSLEVKSLGGEIAYNGRTLTINGRELVGKNFLEQAFGEARAIGRFLRQHLDVDIYVKPVLLFSYEYATMQFGLESVDNVYIIQKHNLFSLIHSFPDYEWQRGERDKVEALLRIAVQ
jgi:hypothetical protein